jgi:predicted metal-dependent peptidase
MDTEFNLNMHVARLLMKEPFFASLSRNVSKTASTAIATAGVRVNPDTARFEMIYNPGFFAGLSDVQRLGVLKHEFYHLIFEHVTSRRPDGSGEKFNEWARANPARARMWNFATDLAINSHLHGELPAGCLMPGEGMFAEFPTGLSAEAYFALLQEKQDEGKDETEENGEGNCKGEGEPGNDPGDGEGSGGGDGQFDSHEGWGDVDATSNEIAKERLKEVLKKATEDAAKGNGWGSVPGEVRKDIAARLTTHVDWKKVLRYFVKTSTRANKRSTVKRVNKRYRYIHPGKKVTRQARIAISIDQSGSVDDAMLETFFSELNKLAKLASFTVIPFDTRVDDSLVYEWKKGQNHKTQRVMCGGTDFNPPTEYVNKHGFDGHIVLTDLMAPKPKASKCQRMWMTTKYYAQRPYFKTNERILAVDVKEG